MRERLGARHDFPGSRERADPGRSVDTMTAEVDLVLRERLAGVEADPYVGRDPVVLRERALDRDGGLDRSSGTIERGEEAVAGLLDHLAALCRQELAQGPVVPGQELLPLGLSERLGELRRVDDVREHEGSRERHLAEELGGALSGENCAETLEGGSRVGQLLVGALVVTELSERDAEEQLRLGRLVRDPDLAPDRNRAGQLVRGSLGIPFRETDLAPRKAGRRLEGGRRLVPDPKCVDQLLELGRSFPRRLQVTGREGDLDLRGEAPDAAQRFIR